MARHPVHGTVVNRPSSPDQKLQQGLARDRNELKKMIEMTVRRRNDIVHPSRSSRSWERTILSRASCIHGHCKPLKRYGLSVLALMSLLQSVFRNCVKTNRFCPRGRASDGTSHPQQACAMSLPSAASCWRSPSLRRSKGGSLAIYACGKDTVHIEDESRMTPPIRGGPNLSARAARPLRAHQGSWFQGKGCA